MDAKNFEVLFFDLGNTLMYFDTSPDVITERANLALYRKLAGFGINVSEPEFLRTFLEFTMQSNHERNVTGTEQTTVQTVNKSLTYLGTHHYSEEQIKQAVEAYFSEYQEHWRLGDDTWTTLDALKKRGYRMGIISNASDRDDIRVLMKKGNLEPFFEHVIVSAEVGFRKPHSEIFREGLQVFHTTPERCAMVGDTLSADIVGANQVGIASIWINRWSDTVENRLLRESIQPYATISHLSEILVSLKKGKKKAGG